MNKLDGLSYQNKAIRWVRRAIRQRFDAHSSKVIYQEDDNSQDFENNVLLPVINEGRITRRQANQLEQIDAIIQCTD